MATSAALDPRTLAAWEDAFQHPLPAVRKLEQQLRSTIDENRQKLRSLVGTSYRDLLGTAERITEMDVQIQRAEQHMGDIGRKCNARLVERIADNHAHLQRSARAGRGARRMALLAQMRVLQGAVTGAGRIVRGGGDALVAAKLVVLARLLFKSVGEAGEERPLADEEWEDLRRKLALARRRLLSYLARSAARTGDEQGATANTLGAYSLITSSAPKDVLRYFLQVRLEQLQARADAQSAEGLVEMLDLYGQTLLDTRELFPRRFTETLSQLSKTALVQDADVRAVYQLGLDIYEQWIADDVRNFHPWVRHDQLTPSEVGEALASWSRQAQRCLLQGLTNTLKDQGDAHAVLSLRHKVLTKYLSLSARLRGVAHSQTISDIRTTFLEKLEDLASQAAGMLTLELGAQQPDAKDTPRQSWDLATSNMDISDGAIPFRKAVIQKQHGRDAPVNKAIQTLDVWIDRLEGFAKVLATMRSAKWDDDLDLDLDDLDEGESLQAALNKDDPNRLEAKLNDHTTTALLETYREVEKCRESDVSPAFLIRVLREIDRRRRGISDRLHHTQALAADRSFVAKLHEKVAASVSERSISEYTSRGLAKSHVPMSLWDGSPPMPVQATVATFRFLRGLQADMSIAGNDLWSPDAVRVLKKTLVERLGDQLSLDWAEQEKAVPLTNGHSKAQDDQGQADGSEQKDDDQGVNGEAATTSAVTSHDRLVQGLFDVLYLQRILDHADSGTSSRLDGLVEQAKGKLDLEAGTVERVRKNAGEYWKRTHLLFGLLATGHHGT